MASVSKTPTLPPAASATSVHSNASQSDSAAQKTNTVAGDSYGTEKPKSIASSIRSFDSDQSTAPSKMSAMMAKLSLVGKSINQKVILTRTAVCLVGAYVGLGLIAAKNSIANFFSEMSKGTSEKFNKAKAAVVNAFTKNPDVVTVDEDGVPVGTPAAKDEIILKDNEIGKAQ